MNNIHTKIYLKCGAQKIKVWSNLSDDEKKVVEKLKGRWEIVNEKITETSTIFCARC